MVTIIFGVLWIHNTKAPFGTFVGLAPDSNVDERNKPRKLFEEMIALKNIKSQYKNLKNENKTHNIQRIPPIITSDQ